MIAKGLLVCDLSIVNERWKESRKVGEIVPYISWNMAAKGLIVPKG